MPGGEDRAGGRSGPMSNEDDRVCQRAPTCHDDIGGHPEPNPPPDLAEELTGRGPGEHRRDGAAETGRHTGSEDDGGGDRRRGLRGLRGRRQNPAPPDTEPTETRLRTRRHRPFRHRQQQEPTPLDAHPNETARPTEPHTDSGAPRRSLRFPHRRQESTPPEVRSAETMPSPESHDRGSTPQRGLSFLRGRRQDSVRPDTESADTWRRTAPPRPVRPHSGSTTPRRVLHVLHVLHLRRQVPAQSETRSPEATPQKTTPPDNTATIPRRGLRFLRARWTVLVRLGCWSVLETGQTFLVGYGLARALDAGFLVGRGGVGLGWLGVAGVGVVVGAFGTGRVYRGVADLVEPLRDLLVQRVVARGVREANGGALSGLTQQVELARDTFAGLVMVSRSFLFTAVGALAGLFSLDPLLLLVVAPPLVAGVCLFTATLRPLARRQETFLLADEALADRLGTVCPGLRDITAAGAEERVATDTGHLVDAELRAARSLARWGVLRVTSLAIGGQLPIVLLLATAPGSSTTASPRAAWSAPSPTSPSPYCPPSRTWSTAWARAAPASRWSCAAWHHRRPPDLDPRSPTSPRRRASPSFAMPTPPYPKALT